MALNGIDISDWQRGIDLTKIPGDFAIVKATQGTNITNTCFTDQVASAMKAGKQLGFYHYISGGGAEAEMNHFFWKMRDHLGKGIVALDWEPYSNAAWQNEAYLKQCINEIKRLTGQTIALYCSPAYYPWDVQKATGCHVWMAQYANNNTVHGYQSKPWNEGAYDCLIRQYSGNGRLDGYSGDLDLDKAYCSKEEWSKIAGGKYVPSAGSSTAPMAYDLYMQSRTASKVLPKVKNNEDNAGTTEPMTYLAAWTTPGILEIRARCADHGWLPPLQNPSNINDPYGGSVGDGTPITGIQMYYYAPNRDRAVHYRVMTEDGKWLPWMIDHHDTGGSGDDFAGNGKRILRVEAYIGDLP